MASPAPMKLYPEPSDTMSQFWIDKFEKDAARNWDVFYKRNKANFFKDRHYLDKEFPELAPTADGGAGRVFAEVGCGAGNTVMPLAELHPNARFHACDFSPKAVDLVKERAQEAGISERVNAFVCDVTREPLVPSIPAGTVDALTLIFVLSAMSPETMPAAVRHCAAAVAPGGRILVRDYAAGDLAEARFDSKSGCQKLGDNFYVRSDGTRAYYFTEERLRAIFEAEGLACAGAAVHERDIQNRARALKMDRRWIQATFVKPGGSGGRGGGPSGGSVGSGAAGAAGEEGGGERWATEADGLRAMGGDLTWCFAEPEAARREVSVSLAGGQRLSVAVVGREHQHTERATGLMLWEGASALANHVAASGSGGGGGGGCAVDVAGRSVLELGAGSSGLPSMAAALSGARLAVATDGHPDVLEALAENVRRNGFELDGHGFGHRDAAAVGTSGGAEGAQRGRACISVRRLRWGDAEDVAAARGIAGPGGFDLVMGADLVYERSALPLLFATAAGLLATGGELLLCHVSNRGGVNEAEVVERALAAGLEVDRSGAAGEAAVEVAASGGAGEGGGAQGAPCRLLRFRRRQG